ncbi:hypothetical protein ACN28E_24910 [Archangium lansingense]|uniref:hypothetical protein n=1 Tax=Archangium lansingense TaxID=2995310 RepID=UPI003B797099
MTTIEEAELFVASRGVVLTGKKEDTDQIVAPRSYDYVTSDGVRVGVTQFHTEKAATTYRRAFEDVPLGGETYLQRGRIIISIWGATDAKRQAVIKTLE